MVGRCRNRGVGTDAFGNCVFTMTDESASPERAQRDAVRRYAFAARRLSVRLSAV
jgi:hypothetical protein